MGGDNGIKPKEKWGAVRRHTYNSSAYPMDYDSEDDQSNPGSGTSVTAR